MNKKILKYKWAVIILTFIIIIGIPVSINESYKATNGYMTLWGASEALGFYGSLLSFLGTMALGFLALHQNNRLTKLEERRFELELQPFVTVKSSGSTIEIDGHTLEKVINIC